MFKYRKSNGSLVVEAAISVMVFSLASVFVVNAHIENCNIIKRRILNENVMRNIENLKCEIKYNLNNNDIDNLFQNEKIGFKYDDDFGKQFLVKKINEFEIGNDIVIEVMDRNEEKIEFKVNAHIHQDNIRVDIIDEFNKSWWMYEEI